MLLLQRLREAGRTLLPSQTSIPLDIVVPAGLRAILLTNAFLWSVDFNPPSMDRAWHWLNGLPPAD